MILNYTKDRLSIQEYLSCIIDPMKSLSHPGGQLLNIVSGEMASEKANPHEDVANVSFKLAWGLLSTNNKASYSNGYQEELLRYETIEYMTKALFMLERVTL